MKNRLLLLIALCMLATAGAMGFDASYYAEHSRLAQGRWVKVSVPESGMYIITKQQLRDWGFSQPERVRIYGYGGRRIPQTLTTDGLPDDLPMAPCELTDQGLVFYGVGPEDWTLSLNGIYVNNPNIYTNEGYYFLSDTGEDVPAIPQQGEGRATENAVDSCMQFLQYEWDRVSIGEAGWLLTGESFKAQSTRKFSFDIATDSIAMEVGIVTNHSAATRAQFSINGEPLKGNSTDQLVATTASTYLHGNLNICFHKVKLDAQKIDLTISIPDAPAMKDCALDYICINARRPIELGKEGWFAFTAGPSVRMASATEQTRVWDVTDPVQVSALRAAMASDGKLQWTSDYHGDRRYAAWNPGSAMPSPAYVGVVQNQDLHSMEAVDMVIFTLPAFRGQAERIAALHRNEDVPLKVAVLDVNAVYNEFASGMADVSALRRCLKMLYDRSKSDPEGPMLRYALIMGRATYDNRHLTSQFDGNAAHSTVPVWMGGDRKQQLNDNSGYGTDDFIAMLDDDSGSSMGLDKLRIAVGRMPVRTVNEAKRAVDKLEQYYHNNKGGTWRNSFLFLADDGNMGIHVEQTEDMIKAMDQVEGSQHFVSKVYVDAYDIVAGSCEGGRSDMYRMLNEGTMWWNFCGHANNHSWTGENMLNYNDINNLYLTRLPVLLAATCDFLRWDSNTISGGEIFWLERYGGTIATISATRPVYITDNGYFTRAVGRSIGKRDDNGMLPRLGDIYRQAKNDIRNDDDKPISNTNRLRYVLMGDPAMALSMPSNLVRLERIAGQDVDPETQVTLMALQRAEVEGSVTDPAGNIIEDFNGTVELVIYDAERSLNTKGVRDDNVRIIFDTHGDRLYAGSAKVENGRFTANISMPGEVADNFRPATMNMYAYCSDSRREAVGINRDFYVFGLDETVPDDKEAPQIDWLVLNHTTFEPGQIVNSSPMAMAQIRDDVGINLSTAGVGHQMTITLDGTRTYTDVSMYFTPSSDGIPGGSINYPLSGLADGEHSLRLRVWDTNGNSTEKTIDFMVSGNVSPKIYDIYCDANPAKTEANFYISHDRPDGEMTVTIEVYTLGGRKVWESTVNGRSDMFLSAPVNWDLCDSTGRRVPRGIYLYRATISDGSDTKHDTGSRKLAVAAE